LMQVGGGMGYEVDEEYEEWEDNLPFELERLQQHPQLMDHLIKEHQAAHERDLAQYEPAPEQPSGSSSASWLRKHDTSRSLLAWLGSVIAGLLSSSSSGSGISDEGGENGCCCSLEDAALFGEAPVWETDIDCMTPQIADVAAAVLQAEGRCDARRVVWPPAIYDHTDSGCCRQVSKGEVAEAQLQLQAAAGRTAIRRESPVVQQQQERGPAKAKQVAQATAGVAGLAPVAAPAAAATGVALAGAAAPAVPATKQSKRHSPKPVSPAAEYNNSSNRHSSSSSSAAGSPVKLLAVLQSSNQSSSSGNAAVRNGSSSSSSAGSASKLVSHHKRNMSAIQE
jgi:hypothetical protein